MESETTEQNENLRKLEFYSKGRFELIFSSSLRKEYPSCPLWMWKPDLIKTMIAETPIFDFPESVTKLELNNLGMSRVVMPDFLASLTMNQYLTLIFAIKLYNEKYYDNVSISDSHTGMKYKIPRCILAHRNGRIIRMQFSPHTHIYTMCHQAYIPVDEYTLTRVIVGASSFGQLDLSNVRYTESLTNMNELDDTILPHAMQADENV